MCYIKTTKIGKKLLTFFVNCSGFVVTDWPLNVARAMVITEISVQI